MIILFFIFLLCDIILVFYVDYTFTLFYFTLYLIHLMYLTFFPFNIELLVIRTFKLIVSIKSKL